MFSKGSFFRVLKSRYCVVKGWVYDDANKGLSVSFNENVYDQNPNYILFNPVPHNDTFWHPWETSRLKTLWEKEKLLITRNFSFTHSIFYLFKELSDIFIKFKIVVCKLFQFGPV